MKKFLSLALVLILVLATLASCNFGKKSEETTTQAPQKEETPAYDINSAVVYLENLYKDGFKANPKTAVDYDMVAQVMIKGLTYKVTWTVDTDKVTVGEAKDGKVTINVDEKSAEEVKYTLTATITAADNSASKTVTFKDLIVPLYGLMSWDEYIAAKTGDVIPEVRGVVTGIVSKSVGASYNCLFLQDATGGAYYIYGMPEGCDPIADLNIEIGMTVSVAGGVKDVYNGTHEVKPNNGALQVTILSTEKTPVAPMDYTEIFTKAADLKAAELVKYQSSLVTLKGVEITGQDLDNGYLKFTLAGKEAYLRISGSTLAFPKADKDAFIAEHAAKKGYTADVTGIISLYSGAFYLVPVSTDAFVYGAATEKTPAEKVDSALSGLKVLASLYNKNTVVELPAADATYADVIFTWASNNAAAVVADGKLTITLPDVDTDIVITVTATCGDAEDSKEFTVKLTNFPDANSFVDLQQADKIGLLMGHNKYTEGKYFVTGTIISIDPDKNDATKLNSYGNMTIQDADGNTLYIYGLYTADGVVRFDKMETQPKVGDTITVYGILGQYNDKAQMKNGWIVDAPAADSELSIVGANSIGLAQGHNKYTADKYIVTGTIESIDPDKNDATKLNAYGNMTIKDADGNTFYLYGLYTADGSVRFDKMEAQPKVGDTITVYGILGQYNGKAQMKNAWLYVAPEGGDNTDTPEGGDNTDTPEGGETPEGGDTPAAPTLSTTKEIYEAAAQLENNVPLNETTYTMTGVIAAVNEAYNTQYGNITVTITVDGYSFKCYRMKGEGADQLAAGDTITVSGTITAYGGAPQFATGCTLVSYEKGEVAENQLTLSFADKANRTEFSNDIQVWVQNGITVTNNKAASTSNVGDYNGRFYKSSDVIIACNGMTKIEINCAGLDSKYVTPWTNVTGATVTNVGGIVTIEFASPVNELVYTTLSAQARANSITVYVQG